MSAWIRLAMMSGLLCLAQLTATCAGDANPPASNTTRVEECGARSASVEPSERLNEAARELANGGQLKGALDRIDYPAARAQSVYVQGRTDDASIREIIEDHLCIGGNDAAFEQVGVYRAGDEAWIVLATPIERPRVEDSAAVAARVLELVNAARGQPRRCGRRRLAAAPALTLSRALTEAAASHARDMARHGALDHRGSDGSTPDERVSRAGYAWGAVGENIAAGQPNAEAVVASWLDSAEHCTNIMGRQFTDTGIAFALASSADRGIYWVQLFAAPE
jgi:uncharacterized protein YkwD